MTLPAEMDAPEQAAGAPDTPDAPQRPIPASPFSITRTDRQVIVTKVRPPLRRRDMVSRPRLVEYLSANVDRKLLLVSAAPGYGKTSLVVDFVHQSGIPACWYRVEDADTDLTVFFEHVIASLRQRFSGACDRTLAQLHAERNPDPEVLVGSLVNEISEDIDEFFLLVLDDYEKLDDSAVINAAMDFFLRYLPDNCRVAVCSRTLPKKLTLTRLAGEGQVLGVGQEHLRFRPDEIRTLVQHLHHETLSATEAEELADKSEGWIAALVMGSSKLLDGVRTGLDLPRGASGQLFDFLAAEVMADLPPETSSFLSQTSILEALSPAVCDAVTGRTDSRAMLEHLEEQNLFLVRIAGTDHWYRYHNLFQDFLVARLAASPPPDLAARHKRAAEWFAANGMPDYEISHLLAAHEYILAAERIEDALADATARGRWRTLERWITGLPDDVRRAHPGLLAQLGVAYAYLGRLPEAITAENRAVEAFEAAGDRRGVAAALTHRSYAWRFMGQVDAALADSRRAIEILGPEPDPAVMAELHRSIGASLSLQGDMEAAAAELTQALAEYERLNMDLPAAHTHADLSAMQQLAGDVESSLHHAEEARATFEKSGNMAALALALNNIGTAYYSMGRMDDARRYLEESVRTARLVGVHRYVALALAGLADVETDLDNFPAALVHYQDALELARESGEGTLVCYCLASLAESQRLRGNLAEALHYSAAAREELATHRSAFESALVDYVRGNIAMDRRELERAAEHLDDAARSFASMRARREQARAHLYRVSVAHKMGDMAAADRAWRQAREAIADFGHTAAFAPQARRLPEVAAHDQIHEEGADHKSLGLMALAESSRTAIAAVMAPREADQSSGKVAGPSAPDSRAAAGTAQVRHGSEVPTRNAAGGATLDAPVQMADAEMAGAEMAGAAVADTALADAALADAETAEDYAPPPRTKPARGRGALDLPPAPLRVLTLGHMEVARDGIPLESGAWETTTARDLFLYLVDHPEGSTRDEILTAFWPESSTPRATSTFHTTLHRIRRALGRAVLDRQVERYYVSVTEGLDYDVSAFEAAIKRASTASGDALREHLEEAAALYGGDYMAGVEMDWARERAEILRVAATAAFMELAKLYLDAGEAEPAAATYQRAAQLAPLEEEAHRGVMLAYAKAGDRVKALQAYDRMAAILEAELGVEPDEASQALRRAIKGREQPAA